MSIRSIITVAFLLIGTFAVSQAQTPAREPQAGDFRIVSMHHELLPAPNYSANGGGTMNKSSTLFGQWLRIETTFESRLDWADDVKLVCYAVLGKQNETKLFKGEVTHVNVMKGPQHYSAMFMPPAGVRRFGSGRVEKVAVQLFYRGRLFDTKFDPPSTQRWWETFTPQQQPLLNPMQTPWAMIAHDHYEAIQPSSSTP